MLRPTDFIGYAPFLIALALSYYCDQNKNIIYDSKIKLYYYHYLVWCYISMNYLNQLLQY